MPERPIVIAYDGSENARHAIEVAARLFPGAAAQVVHAWEPLTSAAARSAVYAVVYADTDAALALETEQAERVAAEGAAAATAAGLQAAGVAISGSGPIWATIVDHLESQHPRLLVMGSRGLTGVRSALVGSVSHQVASHAHVPVLVVPHNAVLDD